MTLARAPSSRALVDWVFRVLFFAAAPFVLVRVSTLVPITGTLVDVALAVLVLFFGETLRGRTRSSGLVRKAFESAFAFDDYYRTHAPRPFVYYAFYPLLFPYWLLNREARREFLMFKSYTLLSLVVLAGTNLRAFFVLYRPELGLAEFVRPFLIGLAVESAVVLAILMPLVTTVVALHREGARMGLFGLLVLASFSSLVGVVRLAIRHQPIVSIETKERIVKRTAKNPDRAVFAFTRALKAARATLSHAPTPLADNGTLGGAPRDAAREALKIYFRKDETNGFELWSSGEHDPKLIVIYTEGEAARRAIWLGQRADGTYVKNVWELPRGARAAMKEAGQL
ncbi:MAG: hypothetical protein U0235_06115 [Polyangiaceae bacterium]